MQEGIFGKIITDYGKRGEVIWPEWEAKAIEKSAIFQ